MLPHYSNNPNPLITPSSTAHLPVPTIPLVAIPADRLELAAATAALLADVLDWAGIVEVVAEMTVAITGVTVLV